MFADIIGCALDAFLPTRAAAQHMLSRGVEITITPRDVAMVDVALPHEVFSRWQGPPLAIVALDIRMTNHERKVNRIEGVSAHFGRSSIMMVVNDNGQEIDCRLGDLESTPVIHAAVVVPFNAQTIGVMEPFGSAPMEILFRRVGTVTRKQRVTLLNKEWYPGVHLLR